MQLFSEFGPPRQLDAVVRAQLADSLSYIVDKAAGHLQVDRAGCAAALASIRTRRQDPGVFARYFDLIFAVNANRFAHADTLLGELIARTAEPVAFAIVPYARDRLGSDYDRFADLLFAESAGANPMASPPAAQSASADDMLRKAIALVGRVDRDIRDEIEALLVRIYLAVGAEEHGAKSFGAVTSLQVWGASFVNIARYDTVWGMVQCLVHEITHSVLFGVSCQCPLVKNPPDESYRSPLRADPRPMDGIFHATLVCARIAAFNRAWLDSGLVESRDRGRTEEAVVRNLQRFQDGVAVIERHAKLSEPARALIDRSRSALPVFA